MSSLMTPIRESHSKMVQEYAVYVDSSARESVNLYLNDGHTQRCHMGSPSWSRLESLLTLKDKQTRLAA